MNYGAAPLREQDSSLASAGPELEERIASVRQRIQAAAERVGRDPAEITLVAVSKTQSPAAVAAACHAGLRLFGENRVEEAGPKAQAVAELLAPAAAPVWHMVGHLQGRKANEVFPWAEMVHSVDSVKLAQRLSRFALEARWELAILLEVNVSGEASKYGLTPPELPGVVEVIATLPGLRLEGLMTMAPIATDPEAVRPVFAELRKLKDEMARRHPELTWRHLSMGMTDDFEVAIEEGATLVRIGRAIFGDRQAYRM
jgi:pyridoxal phosphate enzyme (YggS family)